MAKLEGPLLSESAHGKLAQILIYSSRKEGNISRRFHMPDKEITLKQWTQRHIVGLLTAHWQVMSPATKKIYEDEVKASGLRISGFNYFLKVAQKDLRTHHGLVGYWSMNESDGAQVTDYSGNGNHGTLKPTYPTNCPIRVDAMIKQYGKALSFDGVDDYVNVLHNSVINFGANQNFTVESWFKPKTTAVGVILGKNFSGSGPGYGMRPFTAADFWLGFGGTQSIELQGGKVLLNQWNHTAGVRDGTTLRLYLNGVLVQEKTNALYSSSLMNTSPLQIGIRADIIQPFNGLIDEVRIYNRALSAEEIKKHYELLRLDKKRQPLLIH
jgi:hypothetical protein